MSAVSGMGRVCLGAGVAAALILSAPGAQACSCGCSGTGTAADISAVGGTAGLYPMGSRFLLQEGVSLRTITGSFNELGTWNPPPTEGSLQTLQGSVGLLFFPIDGASIGLTLPVAGNALTKASWGPFGSISPTENTTAFGGGLGDLSLNGTYRVWSDSTLALATWGSLLMPSGQAYGEAPQLTGSGLWSAQAGLSGVAHLGEAWQLVASAGAQLPFAATGERTGTFGFGPTGIAQLQGYYRLDEAWRLGLGLDGYLGQASMGSEASSRLIAKVRIQPSVTYQWSLQQGIRASLGVAPPLFGRNTISDLTVSITTFQYL